MLGDLIYFNVTHKLTDCFEDPMMYVLKYSLSVRYRNTLEKLLDAIRHELVIQITDFDKKVHIPKNETCI